MTTFLIAAAIFFSLIALYVFIEMMIQAPARVRAQAAYMRRLQSLPAREHQPYHTLIAHNKIGDN